MGRSRSCLLLAWPICIAPGLPTGIRSRDEIGMLAAAINQMAAELREKTVSKDYVDNIIHSM
ncbi:MAG: HAMP domain-containing protein, partial [Planctomycetota bacterium]